MAGKTRSRYALTSTNGGSRPRTERDRHRDRLNPAGTRSFQIDFDFVADRLLISVSDGMSRTIALEPRGVADFWCAFCGALDDLGIEVRLSPIPSEISARRPSTSTPPTRPMTARPCDAGGARCSQSSEPSSASGPLSPERAARCSSSGQASISATRDSAAARRRRGRARTRSRSTASPRRTSPSDSARQPQLAGADPLRVHVTRAARPRGRSSATGRGTL